MAQRPRPTTFDINQYTDTELQSMYGNTYTPDDHPISSMATSFTQHYAHQSYQPRTLTVQNYMRRNILPIYPPSSMLTITTAMTGTHSIKKEDCSDLLLCNVPISMLTFEQIRHRQLGAYVQSFVVSQWDFLERYHIDSFMKNFFEKFYSQLQHQWHIDLPILDYNLARLQKLLEQNQFSFTMNELPLALEIYLQMDVDTFNWKTCLMNGLEQYQGIFHCTNEESKQNYCIQRCQRAHCSSCNGLYPRRQPIQTSAIRFDTYRIHRFVHGYDALLNGPVTCETSNIIYVLTCTCGKVDFVGHTDLSLADCLSYHRTEGQRIIRQFLLGNAILPVSNHHRLLYEHSTRCSQALQLFLDYNPLYWCFVPVPKQTNRPNFLPPATIIISSQLSSADEQREDHTIDHLMQSLPIPPQDYEFASFQRKQQKLFFKYAYDRKPLRSNTVDFYNANVVTVLPECSQAMKRFIESLFITHTECQLNEQGHLLPPNVSHHIRLHEEIWCQNLLDRPLSMTF